MNKRSIAATFFFQGINQEHLLEIASSLFPRPGEPVVMNKGNPLNKVIVRSLTFFAAPTESRAFYLLLVTTGESYQVSKFIAIATKLRAVELIPKADFDKETKLHNYLAGLLHTHGVSFSDLDANELYMRAWIQRRLGVQGELWTFIPRADDSLGGARPSPRVDCYAATRKRAAAAAMGEEERAVKPRPPHSRPHRSSKRARPAPMHAIPLPDAHADSPPPPVAATAAAANEDDLFLSGGSPVGTPDSSAEDYIGNWSTSPVAAPQPQQDNPVTPRPQQEPTASNAVTPRPQQEPTAANAIAQWLSQSQPDTDSSSSAPPRAPSVGGAFDIPTVFLDFLRCERPLSTEERGPLLKALCEHYRGTNRGLTNGTALSDLPLLDFLTASARIEEALAVALEQVLDLKIPRPMSPGGYDAVRAVCAIRFDESDPVCKRFLDSYRWLCAHWGEFHTLGFTGMLDRSSTLFVFVVDAVNRCIETTLKGMLIVSKCVPFADMTALVGQDVSKLAQWTDYLCQTSALLVQLTQSTHPGESQALHAVMSLVSHHRQAPTAFHPEHNASLPKSVDSAEDVVRRVLHKVATIRGELLSLGNIDVGQSCYGYKCFHHAMQLGNSLTNAIAADPRGVLSFLQGTQCCFPDNARDEDDFRGFLAAIRDTAR